MLKLTHVFWDWNGTLLDDAGICENVIGGMLEKRGLKPLGGLEGYREAFGFPVTAYYKEIGFDFTRWPYDELSVEFMDSYNAHIAWRLHDGALDALKRFAGMGITQVVLSAGRSSDIKAQMEPLGVMPYFAEIIGASDIYAEGKLGYGVKYINNNEVGGAVMIGDTIHDFEVARELCVLPILFCGGHQSKKRLLSCGAPVIDRLSEVFALIYSDDGQKME